MSNFYDLFDCESKEELKEKIKNNDESIAPLNSLYEKLKSDTKRSRQKIHGTHSWEKFFNNNEYMPEKGKYGVIKLNTKLEVLGYNTFDREGDLKDAYKYLFDGDTVRYALVMNEPGVGVSAGENEKQREILNFADKFENKIPVMSNIDVIIADEDNGNLLTGRNLLTVQSPYIGEINNIDKCLGQNARKTFNVDYGLTDEEQRIYDSEQFNEFTQEHVKKKIEGLNMVNDEEELMKQLKLGNQDHQSEHFSLITYDQNYDVNDYHIESIGGTRSTVVDVKRFAPLITDDNVHGIALCHNHPSGDPEPSDADKETTQNMIDFTNVFDKQVYDHYVVGRSSVRKLSGERTLWNLSKQKEEIVNEFSKPRQLEMLNESESSLVDLSNEEREAIEKRAIYDEITGRPINNLEPVYQLGCGDEVMSPAIHEKIFSDEEWYKLYEKDGDSFFYTEIQYDMEVPVQELEDNPTFKNNYKLNGKDIGTLSNLGKILTDDGEVDGIDRLDELVKDIYLNNRQDIGYTLYNDFEPVDLKEKYGIEIVHDDSNHDITQDEFER